MASMPLGETETVQSGPLLPLVPVAVHVHPADFEDYTDVELDAKNERLGLDNQRRKGTPRLPDYCSMSRYAEIIHTYTILYIMYNL